tara:strand:- start:1796 stop:2407 length:612 start_codon:yes stop_codon:yes gene_type:complete
MAVSGDQSTLYGRMDTSAFVNVLGKKAMMVHKILMQPRNPDGTSSLLDKTGAFVPLYGDTTGSETIPGWTDRNRYSAFKIVACNTAFEDLSTVGIASDGVYKIQEYNTWTASASVLDASIPNDRAVSAGYALAQHGYEEYDLSEESEGILLMSDLLFGIATDNWFEGTTSATVDIELDVVVYFTPTTVTNKQLLSTVIANTDV